MPSFLEFTLPSTAFGWYAFVAQRVVNLCVVAIFIAIAVNFIEAKANGTVASEKKSPVATGSMILFFVVVYLLIRCEIGVIALPNTWYAIVIALGILVMVAGTMVNILGRLALGRNWANHATIYETQTLVNRGVFLLVRHPLYASLIWMYFGAGLIYANWAVIAANACIFIPAMIYRARLEERLLVERFSEYNHYQRCVGMFFPKLLRRNDNACL